MRKEINSFRSTQKPRGVLDDMLHVVWFILRQASVDIIYILRLHAFYMDVEYCASGE